MRPISRELTWRDLTVWVFSISTGWAVNLFSIMLDARDAVGLAPLGLPIEGAILGFAGGGLIALSQGLLMRNPLRENISWLWATILGMTLGGGIIGIVCMPIMNIFQITAGFRETRGRIEGWILAGAVVAALAGAVVGLCQGRVLRHSVSNSHWWVAVTTLGWAAGGVLFWFIYGVLDGPLFLPWFRKSDEIWPDPQVVFTAMAAGWVVGGIVVGTITGIALKFILMQTNRGEPPGNHQ